MDLLQLRNAATTRASIDATLTQHERSLLPNLVTPSDVHVKLADIGGLHDIKVRAVAVAGVVWCGVVVWSGVV